MSKEDKETKVLVEKEKGTIASYLADWFYEQGDHTGLEYLEVAIKIAEIKNPELSSLPKFERLKQLKEIASEMEMSYLGNHVSNARAYLENRFQKTIVNVKGFGYKLATKQEASRFMAVHTAKWVKGGFRVKRGLQTVDRRSYTRELEDVMPKMDKLLNDVHRVGTKFLTAYQGTKEKKKEKEKRDAEEK